MIHGPAYSDDWALAHSNEYSLKSIDGDNTKRPLALKIEERFGLPLELPSTLRRIDCKCDRIDFDDKAGYTKSPSNRSRPSNIHVYA
jgi:hypothetical protein